MDGKAPPKTLCLPGVLFPPWTALSFLSLTPPHRTPLPPNPFCLLSVNAQEPKRCDINACFFVEMTLLGSGVIWDVFNCPLWTKQLQLGDLFQLRGFSAGARKEGRFCPTQVRWGGWRPAAGAQEGWAARPGFKPSARALGWII